MSSNGTNASHKEIAAGAGGVALATLMSRILGLIRDTIIASIFSAFQTDCFFMAFTIPNVLRRILGEGSLSAAVVPVYTDLKEKESAEKTKDFLRALWGTALVLLCITSIIGVLASPVIVSLYAWGFTSVPEKFHLTNNLNRIMFSYLFFVGLTAISSGILNVHKKFFAPALSPALWNTIMILSAIFIPALLIVRGVDTVYALAIGVMAGGFVQLVYQIILQRWTGTLPAPRINFRNEDMKKVGRLLVPLLAGFGIYQVDILLSRLLASFLPQGSVSYLYYATRLIEFPQGVIFLALGTASLPMMSRLVAKNNLENLKETYLRMLSLTFFFSIPSAVGLIVMAKPIISIVFFRGAFTLAMFKPTWMALALMAFGILGTAVVRVTSPVYYSFKDTKTPVIIAGVNLVLYISLCLTLMFPYKHLGLAIALSIAPITQAALLVLFLQKKTGSLPFRRLIRSIVKFLLAAACMALVMRSVCSCGHWEQGGNTFRNILTALAAGTGGAITYFFISWILRVDELKLIRIKD